MKQTSPNKVQEETKKYRLVVRSAEEAVRLIREKLGDHARVTSVRQVGGEGLKRFISSPKLEVIAEVGPPQESEGESDLSPMPTETDNNPPAPLTQNRLPADEVTSSDQTDKVPSSKSNTNDIGDVVKILARSGFDSVLLDRLEAWSEWENIKGLPLADALREITKGLADRLGGKPNSSLSDSVALLGSPGVGKTTTLCKLLAHEVFINKRVPNVLKIENGMPNPDDALRIFCEVIGVTLYREVDKCPEASSESPLYVDFPGLSLTNAEEWSKAGEILDSKGISSRILVVNGAYDTRVLQRSIQHSAHAKSTHLAITHFDELSNSTKLWPILLDSELVPFCICNGQNVTGDVSRGVINQLIARTFPGELYHQGLFSYQKV